MLRYLMLLSNGLLPTDLVDPLLGCEAEITNSESSGSAWLCATNGLMEHSMAGNSKHLLHSSQYSSVVTSLRACDHSDLGRFLFTRIAIVLYCVWCSYSGPCGHSATLKFGVHIRALAVIVTWAVFIYLGILTASEDSVWWLLCCALAFVVTWAGFYLLEYFLLTTNNCVWWIRAWALEVVVTWEGFHILSLDRTFGQRIGFVFKGDRCLDLVGFTYLRT